MYLCQVEPASAVEHTPAMDAVFQPVQPPTTFEETVERLGTAIRLGLLSPASRLPPERDLAGRLRISRSTLRQALTTLVQSGHLVSVRGRAGGTFVADQPPLGQDVAAEVLGDGARAVLDYRVAVETGAAALAAERAEGPDLDRLESLIERMDSAGSFEDYRRADVRFHIGIAEAARSSRLVAAIDRGAGPDERPDRADRPSAGGAAQLQPPAPQARRAVPQRRQHGCDDARPTAHRGHRAHPGGPAASLACSA